jgi:hypothetical protein
LGSLHLVLTGDEKHRGESAHQELISSADAAMYRLASVVRRALDAGCLIVASRPARGGVVYPAQRGAECTESTSSPRRRY